MDNLELLIAQALCDSGGSRHNPCRYHIAGAKAALNALAGDGMVVVPREPTEAIYLSRPIIIYDRADWAVIWRGAVDAAAE